MLPSPQHRLTDVPHLVHGQSRAGRSAAPDTRVGARAREANLDDRTLLLGALRDGTPPSAPHGWQVTYYPDAKEAAIVPIRPGAVPCGRRADTQSAGHSAERAADNARRAVQRARGEARRYCRANKLRYLWVLTYRGAGCHSWPVMVEHLRSFFQAVAHWHMPLLVVPEWHPGGHGLHVNLALGQYIHWRHVQAAWPHGNVKAPRSREGASLGKRRLDPGRLAGYVAGYVAAGASVERGELGKPGAVTGPSRRHGGHRYFVAQGHQPRRLQDAGATLDELAELLMGVFHHPPGFVWRSWEDPTCHFPRGVYVLWADYWPRDTGRSPP